MISILKYERVFVTAWVFPIDESEFVSGVAFISIQIRSWCICLVNGSLNAKNIVEQKMATESLAFEATGFLWGSHANFVESFEFY